MKKNLINSENLPDEEVEGLRTTNYQIISLLSDRGGVIILPCLLISQWLAVSAITMLVILAPGIMRDRYCFYTLENGMLWSCAAITFSVIHSSLFPRMSALFGGAPLQFMSFLLLGLCALLLPRPPLDPVEFGVSLTCFDLLFIVICFSCLIPNYDLMLEAYLHNNPNSSVILLFEKFIQCLFRATAPIVLGSVADQDHSSFLLSGGISFFAAGCILTLLLFQGGVVEKRRPGNATEPLLRDNLFGSIVV